MPHVITQSCCNDASCVYACPVNCIQPTPDDPAFTTAEMLHIDPAACVDCGACVPACPVGAIKPHLWLEPGERPFAEINAVYHRRPRARPLLAPVPEPLRVRRAAAGMRIAVVGSGPAGMYAADEVLTIPGGRVTVYERLSVPYGLARFGVAPDHPQTRAVARVFDQIRAQNRLTLRLGVEVGQELTHEDLLASHDAVIYAVGAPHDRPLRIPGTELPGFAPATEFVAWYNGHPDQAGRSFDLSSRRAMVIGNGNVALDVARILALPPQALERTEIAPAALAGLRESAIEEIVVVGRRGPEQARFTLPELVGLAARDDIEVVAELEDACGRTDKLELLRSLPAHPRARRRIVFRFGLTPERLLGSDCVQGLELCPTGAAPEVPSETIPAGLVLSSIGYRGRPVPGLPFDPATGTVPNQRGRVIDPATGEPVPGAYVAGWIKRGPSGFIGTNRMCAQETVRSLAADLDRPGRSAAIPNLQPAAVAA